ncbi:oligosaccharide flippase family protein [Fodinibius saliphilus]|uniref:oligosaccharide flippase family protein n=1 Tax=Fodinibius saliphilus TaxID=1920650 RepID=UPI0011092812|nr:oligosaccharide flippase family protein [Fodinibius saliphilus]
MSIKEELKKGAFVNFLGILGKIAGPSFLVLVTRYYGPDLFGIFITANLAIEIALAFLTSGFKDGALIFVARHADHKEQHHHLYRSLSNALALSMGLSFLLIVLSYLVGPVVFEMLYADDFGNQLQFMLLTMGLVLPLMAFDRIVTAATQGLKIMKYDAMVNGGIRPVFLLLYSIGFWYIWPTLTGLTLGYISTQVTVALVATFIYQKELSWAGLFQAFRSFKFDKELLDFALPQNLNMTLNKFITGLDVLMLPIFGASASMVGFYGAGSMIVREIRNVKLIFSSAFAPHIVRFYEKNDLEGLSKNFSMTAKWIASITIPIIIGVAIFREDLLRIVHPEFGQSALFMLILLPIPYMYCSYSLAGNIVTMTGHSKLTLFNSVVVSASNFLLNLWLIPLWGMEGAALASALATFTLTLMELAEARYFVGAKLHLKQIYKPHLAGLAVSLLLVVFIPLSQFSDKAFFNHLVQYGVVLLIYGILLFGFRFNFSNLKKQLSN